MSLMAGDGVCCCCLSCIGLNQLLSEHNVMLECFKLDIKYEESSETEDIDKYLICQRCTARLKDAFRFRLQISAAQESIKNGFLNMNKSENDVSMKIKEEVDFSVENVEMTCDFDETTRNSVDVIKVEFQNQDEKIETFPSSPKNNINMDSMKRDNAGAEQVKSDAKINIEFISCEPNVELQDSVSDMEDDMTLENFKIKNSKNQNSDSGDVAKSRTGRILHIYKCKKCPEEFTSYNRRLTHLNKVHNEDVYRFLCDHCPKKFRIKFKLKEHISFAHLKDKKFICDICKKYFIDKKALRVHIETHKNKPYSEIPPADLDEKFICNICKDEFNSRPAMKDHFRMHYSDGSELRKKKYNLFRCNVCKETFKSCFQRVSHMADMHGVDVHKYACVYCPKKFRANSKLREHVDFAHFKSRKHVCDICQKDFIDKKSLRIHTIKHTGIKTFECDVCNKFFGTTAILNQHKKTHKNIKDYVCHICAKAFTQGGSLAVHMKRHKKKDYRPRN